MTNTKVRNVLIAIGIIGFIIFGIPLLIDLIGWIIIQVFKVIFILGLICLCPICWLFAR